MLKTVIKWGGSTLGVLAAIATIGAYVAPDLGQKLVAMPSIEAWIASNFGRTQVMTDPIWWVFLCLAFLLIVVIFLLIRRSPHKPSERPVHIADMSLNELLVIEAMYQLDGESVSPSGLAQQLNLKKLEIDVALQALEHRELVESIFLPFTISSTNSPPRDLTSFFFSEKGKKFAVTTVVQRKNDIKNKKADSR